MSTIKAINIQHPSSANTNIVMDANGNMTVAGTVSGATPTSGMRNALINGNFDIWQRGTSGFSLTSYAADRWVSSTNGTGSVYQSSFTAGQTAVPNNPTYYLSYNKTNTADYAYLAQRIEDVRTFAGQTVTVSFYAKADASTTIAGNIGQNFGSGGSNATSTAFTFSDSAVTTSWKRFTGTLTLPSTLSKTIGTSSFISLAFLPASSSSSWTGTFDIAQVQLELGTVATAFERRPIALETALCEYYYKKLIALPGGGSGYGALSYYGGTSAVIYHGHFTMRTSPNTSYLNNAAVQYYSYAGVWTASTASINRIGSGPYFVSSWFTSDGDGRGKLMRKNDANDLILVLDAEL